MNDFSQKRVPTANRLSVATDKAACARTSSPAQSPAERERFIFTPASRATTGLSAPASRKGRGSTRLAELDALRDPSELVPVECGSDWPPSGRPTASNLLLAGASGSAASRARGWIRLRATAGVRFTAASDSAAWRGAGTSNTGVSERRGSARVR